MVQSPVKQVFPRDGLYSPGLASWARETLLRVIIQGETDELLRAYHRSPMHVRLESIDSIWWSGQALRTEYWQVIEDFCRPQMVDLSDAYYDAFSSGAVGLEDISTLYMLAVLSSAMDIDAGQLQHWMSLLVDLLDRHYKLQRATSRREGDVAFFELRNLPPIHAIERFDKEYLGISVRLYLYPSFSTLVR